ncbi:MAG: YbaN family protein [Pseudomonadota bacterium]
MRFIWLIVGFLALALGAIGVVVPLLPTTPLVLLAVFAFARSSPRLEQKLVESRIFGPIIADWRQRGAIAPRYKVLALLMMFGALSVSLAMGVRPVIIVVQAFCIVAAASYILTRPSR